MEADHLLLDFVAPAALGFISFIAYRSQTEKFISPPNNAEDQQLYIQDQNAIFLTGVVGAILTTLSWNGLQFILTMAGK